MCSGIFAEKVESDGTRNDKTERVGKAWKEDCHKMTQDGPEVQTWTDFEEDCGAVNQARASEINDSGYSAYIAYRGSVVKCARSQVRPFHDDDEAAHEHVTEHMRDLRETATT